MDGVMLEVSGHKAAVVVARVTREEDCDHRDLIVGPELEIMVRIYWLTD